MEPNGVTRREFEDLRSEMRDLRAEVRRLDREGSAANGRLVDRVNDLREDVGKLQSFNDWLVRGLIATVLISIVVAFILQGGAGN